ncbi:MAG TPA: nuclear transport factor 2 family protein [Chthoniobacterales bacterium]|nr:nuclear transport factor 2 family protein [Chthoniobacterales bacterium]
MKVYNILTIMLAGAAASAVQSHAGAGQPMAERELVALMREIDRAHQTSDVATFDRIWADDYVLTDYRGIIKDRARALAEWKASEHRYASYVSDDIRVRVYGEAAVVTARVRRASLSDPQNVGQFRHTRVFVRQRGRWRLVATQVTPIVRTP